MTDIENSGKMKYPSSIIDMHTHMFNADYLPLRGIFWSRGVLDPLNGWLARLSWAITKISKFPSFTPTPLMIRAGNRESAANAKILSVKDDTRMGGTPDLDDYIDVICEDSVKVYYKSQIVSHSVLEKDTDLRIGKGLRSDIQKLFEEIHEEFGDAESAAELGMARSTKTKARLVSEIDRKGLAVWGGGLRRMLRRFLKRVAKFVEHAIDLLDFVWNMTKTEKKLLKRLQNYYRSRHIPFVLVHYMMDMQYPYRKARGITKDGQVKLDFYRDSPGQPSQLSQMKKLAEHSNGTLLGFSAFDPTRFLERGSSDKDIVSYLEKAKSQGMIGFKFYPPLGFRPAQNNISGMDYVVDVFLDYCCMSDTPVFTHCTPSGFELSPKTETGLNADPRFWRTALEKSDTRRKLRLCFGHAGGGIFKRKSGYTSHGWLAKNAAEWNRDDNYAKHVVNLCKEFPNVYCEMANIDSILDDAKHRDNLRENLATQLSCENNTGTFSLSDKIIYGTDWHMVGMVNDVIRYFDVLVDIFNDAELVGMIPAFFHENAEKFLKQEKFVTNAFGKFSENIPSKFS